MNPILFFFGYSRIKADALSATRLLNLCLEHSFPFSGFEGQEDAFMTTLLNDAKLGILCGTITSALIGSLILNKTLPQEGEDFNTV